MRTSLAWAIVALILLGVVLYARAQAPDAAPLLDQVEGSVAQFIGGAL
jgi:hypothetical protein